jgi:hypothetical protein
MDSHITAKTAYVMTLELTEAERRYLKLLFQNPLVPSENTTDTEIRTNLYNTLSAPDNQPVPATPA